MTKLECLVESFIPPDTMLVLGFHIPHLSWELEFMKDFVKSSGKKLASQWSSRDMGCDITLFIP